jgi:hydrogenase maturation protease
VTGSARVLVAGVGNVFFGDDGFGPEVARRLAHEPPDGVEVEDFGIRGLHLAYELLDGYEHAILIDAVPRGERAGTIYVIEPDGVVAASTPDAHRMDLNNVFGYVRVLGGEPPPLTIVGCEPATVEPGMGLSDAVAQAVEPALAVVRRLIDEHLAPQVREADGGVAWSER